MACDKPDTFREMFQVSRHQLKDYITRRIKTFDTGFPIID
jgi:hypothetical protein